MPTARHPLYAGRPLPPARPRSNPRKRPPTLVRVWPSPLPGLEFHQVMRSDDGFMASMKRHYPGSKGVPPAKNIVWAIVELGVVRGYIGISDPSFKLAARRRLGLLDARPLPGTVSCFMYRLEGEGRYRSAEILDAWHFVAPEAWAAKYPKEPRIVHFETMVDPSEVASVVPGATFRRAGYRSLGVTTGRTARRVAGEGSGGWTGKRVWQDGSQKIVLYRAPLPRLPSNEVAPVRDLRAGGR